MAREGEINTVLLQCYLTSIRLVKITQQDDAWQGQGVPGLKSPGPARAWPPMKHLGCSLLTHRFLGNYSRDALHRSEEDVPVQCCSRQGDPGLVHGRLAGEVGLAC